MIMIMNSNTNNVGGRAFSRGGRNPKVSSTPPTKESSCTCSKSLLDNVEDISLCLLKGLAKESWTQANNKTDSTIARWGFKLLALLLTINVGNADLMTESEMDNFIKGYSSSSGFDGMQCIID